MTTRRSLTPQPEAALGSFTEALRGHESSVAICRRLLAGLQRDDEERHNHLVATLATYYQCGLRVDRTAERLFLHRNSVRYRLDRVRSLLHLELEHPITVAVLTIALRLATTATVEEQLRHAL